MREGRRRPSLRISSLLRFTGTPAAMREGRRRPSLHFRQLLMLDMVVPQ